MTWSRTARTFTGVSAYGATSLDGQEIVRISVGTQYADLTPEDAASLGGYLLSKAPEHQPVTQPYL